MEKEGQAQMVACSGAYQDGTLRIVRNGIGIEDVGSLKCATRFNGIWALKASFSDRYLKILF